MRIGPTVSVVIPAYNEECFLGATLESVRAQTYADIVEVVVADGRSTDSTRRLPSVSGDTDHRQPGADAGRGA